MTAPLRLRMVTPIHVDEEELERRRARYAALAPEGVDVHLDNLPADADVPRSLDDADGIAASDACVAAEMRRTDPADYDAVMPDCVLDPGLDRLRTDGSPVPVVGLCELAATGASAVGGRLAAVTRNAAIGDELERRIRLYGLAGRFAGVHVLDLAFDAVSDAAVWNDALDGARERFAGTGVTMILNGCSAVEVKANGSVAVVDPTRAALHLLAAAHEAGLLPGSTR